MHLLHAHALNIYCLIPSSSIERYFISISAGLEIEALIEIGVQVFLHAWREERFVLGAWGDHVAKGHLNAFARVEPDRWVINVWNLLERNAIDDDALRHAKSRVCRHLHGSQMTRWEAERAKFCGTVSRRIITEDTLNPNSIPSHSTDRPK